MKSVSSIGLLLCAILPDLACTTSIADTVDKVLAHFLGAPEILAVWKYLKPQEVARASRWLRNMVVEVNYQPAGSRNRHRITGIDTQPARQRRIPYSEEETDHPPDETVAQYYLRVCQSIFFLCYVESDIKHQD